MVGWILQSGRVRGARDGTRDPQAGQEREEGGGKANVGRILPLFVQSFLV